VNALAVFNGKLYAASYDGCNVYQFDGHKWSDAIPLEAKGQTYAFEIHAGQLFCGTWPGGRVYRSSNGLNWTDAGRLGNELEVMGMGVYNGKLYAGTLPLAEVYRYDGDAQWTHTGRLDQTPNVRYRRAWTMAIFNGRLYCGTLPSGRIYSLNAGASVTYDRELAPGWRHLAAVRDGDRLMLYIDGKLVATSRPFDPLAYDVSNDRPLEIGKGRLDYFCGSLADLQIYGKALQADEIARLASQVQPCN
jgi:outer membrane protein assembly factor BamB